MIPFFVIFERIKKQDMTRYLHVLFTTYIVICEFTKHLETKMPPT